VCRTSAAVVVNYAFSRGDADRVVADIVRKAQTPLGRIGQTWDIAPAAVFPASPDAAWITGETLLVAGGLR